MDARNFWALVHSRAANRLADGRPIYRTVTGRATREAPDALVRATFRHVVRPPVAAVEVEAVSFLGGKVELYTAGQLVTEDRNGLFAHAEEEIARARDLAKLAHWAG